MQYQLIEMTHEHWPQVTRIYREGIETGNATFETEIPDWNEWDRNHLSRCRLIIKSENEILGWAALNPVSHRPVYQGVAEISIYIKATAQGKGFGKILLDKLITCSEKAGIWTLQGAIFPENKASIKLFTSRGFHEVGVRKKLGQMNGVWRDVILIERRSDIL